ncbi:flagellar assembly peptidoglycan hydrolase FlgJ [Teredinibacter turnerae]|uniref:flagellar assembly peptidoglycan hydrolase FlgJ n=1 Tax=Teredinibacter turnerae TaxID=2426 RepID=UPI00037019B7|nr:flagellar assembly peptidoglycan hydrolase FlgJ [Teredinibacter turnerae]
MNSLNSVRFMDPALLQKNVDAYTDLNSLQKLKITENKDEALRKVAEQFESMFLNMMLKSMRDANAVFEKDSMFNSSESNFYRDMYDQQLSLTLSQRNGGIGIADTLYRQMARRYEKDIAPVGGETSLSELKRSIRPNPAAGVPPSSVSTSNDSAGTRAPLSQSPEEFVATVLPAVQKAAEKLDVSASVLAAQSALETGWGNSVLAHSDGRSTFNIFNIKADERWQGDSVELRSLEFNGSSFVPQKSRFRSYESLAAAVDDYIAFIKNNPRYQQALAASADGQRYIEELAEAGYATDPAYAEKIMRTHERVATELASLGQQDGRGSL